MATDEQRVEVKVFGSSGGKSTVCSMDTVRNFVKQLLDLEKEIDEKKQEIKQLVNDFSEEYSIPKKEISIARRMLKSDIDPDITSEIYANISDLVR